MERKPDAQHDERLDEARELVEKRLADLDEERKRLERALAELGGKATNASPGRPRGSGLQRGTASGKKAAARANAADAAAAPAPTRPSSLIESSPASAPPTSPRR